MFVTQVLKPLAPDCVTVTVCPAIVSVPMRSNPVFGCRATLTAPLLEFVRKLTELNHGRIYETDPNSLGAYVFRDFVRNRRKRLH